MIATCCYSETLQALERRIVHASMELMSDCQVGQAAEINIFQQRPMNIDFATQRDV